MLNSKYHQLITSELHAKFCLSMFWFCNDTAVYRFNLCPILPQPFVGALSCRLREEGHIMQWNNEAPLCQLAPIRRTYRLCQNRRRPNCSSMPFTEWGSFIQEASIRHSPLGCDLRNKARGVGVLWCIAWWQCGSCSEESLCLVWGDPIEEWKGNKDGTHAPSKPERCPSASGSDYNGQRPLSLRRQQHVTVELESWGEDFFFLLE